MIVSLSILVPVYSWDVSSLVTTLAGEAATIEHKIEILLLDDGTPDPGIRSANLRAVSGLPENQRSLVAYEELQRNVGRAAVRNLLAARATGTHLLFLDCDVLPDPPDFIARYVTAFEAGDIDVICGGITYRQRRLVGSQYAFYLHVSGRNDVKPAAERNLVPWRHLLTGNIALRKDVFASLPLDEGFSGHGYEDTEWGIRLGSVYRIRHLDNTVSHLGLIAHRHFVDRTRSASANFALLSEKHPEAIAKAPIWGYVRRLRVLPTSVLAGLDWCLRGITLCPLAPRSLQYLAFQLDKAALLAKVLKDRQGG